mmetsp:Transcript_79367/g.222864  ORF Transcript_79367/g.222864 Transcript_79367/m.222864 type:complete len:217 (+) Transcript_79367:571-1221(+)
MPGRRPRHGGGIGVDAEAARRGGRGQGEPMARWHRGTRPAGPGRRRRVLHRVHHGLLATNMANASLAGTRQGICVRARRHDLKHKLSAVAHGRREYDLASNMRVSLNGLSMALQLGLRAQGRFPPGDDLPPDLERPGLGSEVPDDLVDVLQLGSCCLPVAPRIGTTCLSNGGRRGGDGRQGHRRHSIGSSSTSKRVRARRHRSPAWELLHDRRCWV